jgi:anti-sigma regulatory factor (Ser/Thr protein kinase)
MTTVEDGADAVAGEPATMDALPADAAEARALVRSFLALRVPPALGHTVVEADVLLVVSELVTNALRHAGGVTGLRVSCRPGVVEITVRDAAQAVPVHREHDRGWLPGGYGWPLVHRLAEVAVVPLGAEGKLVRATLRF